MPFMFYKAIFVSTDTSNWDVSNVENISYMFKGALRANPDTTKWDVSNVIFKDNVFDGSAYTGKSL